VGTPRDEASSDEDRVGLDPSPPEGGYELYRHRNWHGYYWARENEAGDYEIRSVPSSPGEYSVPGGTFPKAGFEEHYEKVEPQDSPTRAS
jgi:hypothetical protein